MKQLIAYFQLTILLFLTGIDNLTGNLAFTGNPSPVFNPNEEFILKCDGCVDMEDDVDSSGACPTKQPGVVGQYSIVPSSCVLDRGVMNAITFYWDQDIVLDAVSWNTHDTDGDKAKLTWVAVESTGQFDTTVTIFYDGYSARRRHFFQQAHENEVEFDVIVEDKAGNPHHIHEMTLLPGFDTLESTATEAAGWAVTLKKRGEQPRPYSGAIL